MKKTILSFLTFVVVAACAFVYVRQQNKDYYDLLIVSGATPLAVAKRIPGDITLTVAGLVKQEYRFGGDVLNGFATTRIRTREFTEHGDYMGAYSYLGIPVFHILEGISPKKPDGTVFNQPLDILVSFVSSSGKTSKFSFNEIIMVDDSLPITLAYDREPVRPTTEAVQERYAFNVHTEKLTGLRLICPGEANTSRYLDDVVTITYTVLPTPDDLLPARKKGVQCISNAISCIEGNSTWPAVFDAVASYRNDHWVRIGHGHGYEGVAKVSGYHLPSFLKKNFPDCNDSDFFLFVACDGYRALFSGKEIFATADGRDMAILTTLDGSTPKEGFMLTPTGDFFADRAMWGLSYVVRIVDFRIREK